ncbi:hypothetical protein [Thermoactinomyces sp. DSM 45892]|uniref:hypothetical protein n=1 Tax=Thermoactinomyces sp. DSM 45892 TaxID=1882753 RepID=UPI00089A50B0|nr:hypothetical protein [Thermoactinomyces sp. DSM 45892]SDZ32318.1 hypothetical protein SAMN05444416_12119 [Thermoactinomyces sp. DSM 45892]
MNKEQEIQRFITQLPVGEPVRVLTHDREQYVRVERIFEGWIIDYRSERTIYRRVEEAIQFLAEIWNTDLKEVIHLQYAGLEEIEDLGEF